MAQRLLRIAVALVALVTVFGPRIAGGAQADQPRTPAESALEEDLRSLDDMQDFEDLDELDSMELDEDLELKATPAEAAWDPLIGWNRGMFRFNDRLYFWVLKPVADGYRKVVPLAARTGVKNFFHNLSMPIRFVNALLQLKIIQAQGEMARFLVNTTAGVLGFGNPARHYPEMNPPPEDTGQTLGYWGVGPGPFIVWPFLGPSNLRDSFGLAGDYALYPLTYVDSILITAGVAAYVQVNQTSLTIGDYEAIKEAAIDPYIAIREAFMDNRRKMIAE